MIEMRWTPVILLLIAIGIAVIVARSLPETYDATPSTEARAETPVDEAVNAIHPKN